MSLTLSDLRFNEDGLIPAIIQDAVTGEILMLAYMNREAYDETLRTGRVCYYSRSRKKLWRKGEESGHTQKVQQVLVDCDQDCLILKVRVDQGQCHVGYQSCFYRAVKAGSATELERIAEEDPSAEKALTAHLKEAELYASAPPDDGVFRPAVSYPPHERCVELKSLKEYLLAYRGLGIFNENVVNRVLRDLVRAARPRRMTVRGVFTPRGGLQTTVEAGWPLASSGTRRRP